MGSALAGRGIVAVVADHWPAPGARIMGEGGAGFREAVENAVWLVSSAAELSGIEAERLVVYGSLNADLGTFMSPFSRLERPARVLRFVVGSRDEVIPAPIQARHKELFEALREAGHDVAVTTVDDGHIPTTGSPGWQASVDAITGLATEMQ